MEEQAGPYLANGQLVRVLEDWCEPFAGYFSLPRGDYARQYPSDR
jgi:hypothetical protein